MLVSFHFPFHFSFHCTCWCFLVSSLVISANCCSDLRTSPSQTLLVNLLKKKLSKSASSDSTWPEPPAVFTAVLWPCLLAAEAVSLLAKISVQAVAPLIFFQSIKILCPTTMQGRSYKWLSLRRTTSKCQVYHHYVVLNSTEFDFDWCELKKLGIAQNQQRVGEPGLVLHTWKKR